MKTKEMINLSLLIRIEMQMKTINTHSHYFVLNERSLMKPISITASSDAAED